MKKRGACPQITTGAIGLTYPIASAADDATPVRSLAVSPWSAQVVRWFVSLGPGAMECGVGSWRWCALVWRVRVVEREEVSTDCHKTYQPDLLIAPAADAAPVRSLAVSPWSAQVGHWLVFLGQGRWRAGVGSWRWGMEH
ncbi:MAG: hypothetical protein GY832_06280 [Chloroflexi bacterium]|nr:hypothetical protein [Chloroflexota bacterium]